jgi:hypothetical protein
MIRSLVLMLVAAGCASDPEPAQPIAPGQGIGPVSLGMRYHELRDAVGPLASPSQQNRIVVGRYPELGLEVVLTSGSELEVTDDARVIAVGARVAGDIWEGAPRPGQRRADIEAALGPAPEVIGDVHYWEAGVSVELGPGDTAELVAVFAPYTLAPVPAEDGR